MEMYEVGGCVRDEILGVKSKDIDFSVVLSDVETEYAVKHRYEPFDYMAMRLSELGFKIFLRSPEFFTVRAQFPVITLNTPYVMYGKKGFTADFVLARKEGEYTDGRRPDKVIVGTLEDDLARRDFTMNAIAKAVDGSLIDPYNGQKDIADRVIRCVGTGNPIDYTRARLTEDALRAVRAIRFSVTKDFQMDGYLVGALRNKYVIDAVRDKISDERIAVELQKMFRFDTVKSIEMLSAYPELTEAMFAGNVSLDATMKMKGRGNGVK